jgi:hypothetical protein
MLPIAVELNDGLSFGGMIVGVGTLSLAGFTWGVVVQWQDGVPMRVAWAG